MKGFVSVLLVLTMLLFLSRDLKIYDQVYDSVQEIKNSVVLNQKINEITYDLENGFVLTVKEAIETVPPKEELAREYVCSKIYAWFKNYPDYSLYLGYIDPIDYSEAPSVQSEIEPCLNFVHVDVKERKVMLKDNGLIDFPYSLVGYRMAVMFKGKVHGSDFTVLIPEGRVIS